VFEVMLALRISQPRASRHLGVLKAAGFLKSRQKGSRVFYSLDDVMGGKFMFGVSEMADAMALRDASLRIDRERMEMMEAGGMGELIGSYRPLVRKYRVKK
jgi:DNA-binding transcriptional ArsR family regulator